MRRLALLLTVLACLSLLTGFLLQTGAGDWLLALGCALLPVALILLGTIRRGVGARRLRLGILLLFFVLAGVLGTLLFLVRNDPTGAHATTRLLLQVGGLWLVTLILTGIVFPLTFDSFWPNDPAAK